MTIGPEPITSTLWMSVRFGMSGPPFRPRSHLVRSFLGVSLHQ